MEAMLGALLLALLPQISGLCGSFPADGSVVERPGLPGTLCVFGVKTSAVLTDAASPPQAVAAVASVGAGRVFAIAHDGYLAPSFFSQKDGFMRRALAWLKHGAAPGRVMFLGGSSPLRLRLQSLGYQTQAFSVSALAQAQLLIVSGAGPQSTSTLAAIQAWLQQGGAVLAAICPWGWQQVQAAHGWTLATDLAANQILVPVGLMFTEGYSTATSDSNFVVHQASCAFVHCQSLVAELESGRVPSSLQPLEVALRILPLTDTLLLPRLRANLPPLDENHVPTPAHPLQAKGASRLRLALIEQDRRLQASTPEHPQKAPGAEFFPGLAAADATPTTRSLSLDGQQEGWISTGLYLNPGAVVQLEYKASKAQGWIYRIGAHQDTLWHKEQWPRWPSVVRRGPLATRISSPFGGLLYLQAEPAIAVNLNLKVSGAFAAPYWQTGKTSAKEWQRLRTAPAPWAELQGKYLILTLPSRSVRNLEDPKALMAWWDRVVVEQFSLAGEDLPRRPERLVSDVLISAGYMHSGYPIMMHLDVVEPRAEGSRLAPLLDLEELQKIGNWGCFHELGHNRQQSAWTFSGTGEVTNNIFSLYCGEVMSGIEPWLNPWLQAQKQAGAQYLADGADFSHWVQQPGIALLCYAQVQKEFGWEVFGQVFRQARNLAPEERPSTDAAKRSFWIRALSRATARDLRPFYQRWGWPLEESLLRDPTLNPLTVWLPDFGLLRND